MQGFPVRDRRRQCPKLINAIGFVQVTHPKKVDNFLQPENIP
jgi:hypothetical protein